MKNKNAQKLAEEWDIMTDAMQPVIVPDGYKAEYLYEQPVLYDGASLMRFPSNISYLPSYGWGIISVKSEHELNEDELDRYMGKNHTVRGCMRRTSAAYETDHVT